MNNRLNKEDHRDIELKAAMLRAFFKLNPKDFIKAHEESKTRYEKMKKTYKDAENSFEAYKKKVQKERV